MAFDAPNPIEEPRKMLDNPMRALFFPYPQARDYLILPFLRLGKEKADTLTGSITERLSSLTVHVVKQTVRHSINILGVLPTLPTGLGVRSFAEMHEEAKKAIPILNFTNKQDAIAYMSGKKDRGVLE